MGSVQLPDCSVPRGNFDPEGSIREVTVVSSNEPSDLAIELPRNLKYDCGSPDSNPTPCLVIKMDSLLEMASTPASLIQGISEERCQSFETKIALQGICQVDQIKDGGTGCDWENLISDAADLLISDSSIAAGASTEQDQKLVDHETCSFTSFVSNIPQDNTDDLQKTQPVGLVDSCEQQEMEDPATQLTEVGKQKDMDQTPLIPSSTFLNKQVVSDPIDEMDSKAGKCISFGCKVKVSSSFFL